MRNFDKVYRVVYMTSEDTFVPVYAYGHQVRIFIDRGAAERRAADLSRHSMKAVVLESPLVWGPLSER